MPIPILNEHCKKKFNLKLKYMKQSCHIRDKVPQQLLDNVFYPTKDKWVINY